MCFLAWLRPFIHKPVRPVCIIQGLVHVILFPYPFFCRPASNHIMSGSINIHQQPPACVTETTLSGYFFIHSWSFCHLWLLHVWEQSFCRATRNSCQLQRVEQILPSSRPGHLPGVSLLPYRPKGTGPVLVTKQFCMFLFLVSISSHLQLPREPNYLLIYHIFKSQQKGVISHNHLAKH